MPARDQRLLLVAAVTTSAALLLAALAGHAELIAYAAPLCVVALPLLAGRYLGEETLERLRGRAERARHYAAAPLLPGARRSMSAFPRGGRLIAQALAERAPPAPALT
jgi:hypothetical protein